MACKCDKEPKSHEKAESNLKKVKTHLREDMKTFTKEKKEDKELLNSVKERYKNKK